MHSNFWMHNHFFCWIVSTVILFFFLLLLSFFFFGQGETTVGSDYNSLGSLDTRDCFFLCNTKIDLLMGCCLFSWGGGGGGGGGFFFYVQYAGKAFLGPLPKWLQQSRLEGKSNAHFTIFPGRFLPGVIEDGSDWKLILLKLLFPVKIRSDWACALQQLTVSRDGNWGFSQFWTADCDWMALNIWLA